MFVGSRTYVLKPTNIGSQADEHRFILQPSSLNSSRHLFCTPRHASASTIHSYTTGPVSGYPSRARTLYKYSYTLQREKECSTTQIVEVVLFPITISVRLVVFGQLPLVAEYLTAILVKPFALANMQVSGTATDREVLNGMIISKAVGYDRGVLLILMHLDLLLVEPDVETKGGLLKLGNVKVVYQHIRKDGSQQLGMIHAAKVQLYS